jgi:uncharacterized protein (UPF0335 family)
MEEGEIDGRRLRSFIERIERVQEDLDASNEDKAEIFKEAKSDGFDTNVMKVIIKRRRNGEGATEEADALLAIYERALKDGGPTRRRTRARRRGEEDSDTVVPPDTTVQ